MSSWDWVAQAITALRGVGSRCSVKSKFDVSTIDGLMQAMRQLSAYSVDGIPMHSWRVLIAPYVVQNVFYDAYDRNEVWNGPNNMLLMDEIPDFLKPTFGEEESRVVYDASYFNYCCPSASAAQHRMCTNYVMLIDDRRLIIQQVNVVVFHRAPETFNEHVVQGPAMAVHADPNSVILQAARKGNTRGEPVSRSYNCDYCDGRHTRLQRLRSHLVCRRSRRSGWR